MDMDTDEHNHKSKGISVEGFWRQIKDKSASSSISSSIPDSRSSLNLSSSQSEMDGIVSRDTPEPNEDWVIRFDQWLSRL